MLSVCVISQENRTSEQRKAADHQCFFALVDKDKDIKGVMASFDPTGINDSGKMNPCNSLIFSCPGLMLLRSG